MLMGFKLLVIMVWLVIFTPGSSRDQRQVIAKLSDWGSEPEWEFRRTFFSLPHESQLLIVDDSSNFLHTKVLERLLLHHSGVVGVQSAGITLEHN